MKLFKYMDVQAEVEVVKKELVKLIAGHLKENKIPLEKARQLARDFLALLPMKDQMDLLNKLNNLSQTYNEAKTIYVDELTKVSNSERDQVLSLMRDYIKQGNMNQAISVAKSMYKGVN